MIRRRTYLSAVVGTVALAGCLGYEVVPEEEANSDDREDQRLRSTVQNQRDRIADLESDVENRTETIESQNETITQLRSERRRLERELETERQRFERELDQTGVERILAIYRFGHDVATRGVDTYSTATDRWEARNYMDAATEFARAEGYFTHGAAVFGDVATQAAERDNSEAESASTTAQQFCSEMQGACSNYSEAASDVVSGNINSANQRYIAAREHRDRASELEIIDPGDFETRLRGSG